MGTFIVVVGLMALAGALTTAAHCARRNARAKALLADAENEHLLLGEGQMALASSQKQIEDLTNENNRLRAESQRTAEILDGLEKENEWCQHELEKRPTVTRRVYRILTLGISGTGKTALTLKWANPLFELEMLKGTKIERYERTVSHVITKDVTTEHVFEVGDWGGEHIVDALQEAITEEIHGMLLVVDLSAPPPREGAAPRKTPTTVDPVRIKEQLEEFQPQVLRFFFGPRTLASCKTIVLFINKSDVVSGTPSEVERIACGHYERLIKDLQQYGSQIDIRVLVGSAISGHSTHHLFAHFVSRILPKNAYDGQLVQRMMAGGSRQEVPDGQRG